MPASSIATIRLIGGDVGIEAGDSSNTQHQVVGAVRCAGLDECHLTFHPGDGASKVRFVCNEPGIVHGVDEEDVGMGVGIAAVTRPLSMQRNRLGALMQPFELLRGQPPSRCGQQGCQSLIVTPIHQEPQMAVDQGDVGYSQQG